MSTMTWNQLKAAIDKAIKEQGCTGDIEVWYIDVSFPSLYTGFELRIDCSAPKLGLNVDN